MISSAHSLALSISPSRKGPSRHATKKPYGGIIWVPPFLINFSAIGLAAYPKNRTNSFKIADPTSFGSIRVSNITIFVSLDHFSGFCLEIQ